MDNDEVIGVVIAFRRQDNLDNLYVQDVMTDPGRRRRGIARSLLDIVLKRANTWGCKRL
jgi:GNAT superfamily N-acetyltransferase